MIEILTKIRAKITIIVVVENENLIISLLFVNVKSSIILFSYQMLAPTFNYDEQSIYYKVYEWNEQRSNGYMEKRTTIMKKLKSIQPPSIPS